MHEHEARALVPRIAALCPNAAVTARLHECGERWLIEVLWGTGPYYLTRVREATRYIAFRARQQPQASQGERA